MKISKTIQWILTIGILAILLVSLGVMYSRQKAEQSELMTNIAQAQQDFIKHTTQKKDLEARRSEANSRVTSVQDEFRKPTQSIEINRTLFEAAEDAGVTITSLSSSLPAEEKSGGEKEDLKGITFQVFSLSIAAEGEVVPALLNFSMKLSERFPAATIESVSITIPEVEEEGESEEKPTINLGLKIYAYEGE